MQVRQLPMFGTTLISQSVNRGDRATTIEFRQAASDVLWSVVVMNDNPMIESLGRPGSCFALVELASQSVVASRGKF